MAFISSGSVDVLTATGDLVQTLQQGEWVSEPSLWSEDWKRTTRVVAGEDCELLLVSGREIANLYLRLPEEIQTVVATYAVNFMEVLLTHPHTAKYKEIPMTADLYQAILNDRLKHGSLKPTALKMLREVWRSPSFENQIVRNSFFNF